MGAFLTDLVFAHVKDTCIEREVLGLSTRERRPAYHQRPGRDMLGRTNGRHHSALIVNQCVGGRGMGHAMG